MAMGRSYCETSRHNDVARRRLSVVPTGETNISVGLYEISYFEENMKFLQRKT